MNEGQPSPAASQNFHFNTLTGELCGCPWGASKRAYRHRGQKPHHHRQASEGIRRVRNKNMKAFRTPEGQNFLDQMEKKIDQLPAAEPAAEYLASRYPHGEIGFNAERGMPFTLHPTVVDDYIRNADLYRSRDETFPQNPDARSIRDWMSNITRFYGGNLWDEHLNQIGQYMAARQHPLRRGVNVMELPVHDIQNRALELAREVQEKRNRENWLAQNADQDSEIAHAFDNGWTIRHLTDPDHLEAESQALGHCIGSEEQPYVRAAQNGVINVYSLRDPQGYPHATFHHNEDDTLAHVQGKSGAPKSEYRDMISQYHDIAGLPDEEVGDYNYDPPIQLDRPVNFEDYQAQYGPHADLWEYASDLGHDLGENSEVYEGEPHWRPLLKDINDRIKEGWLNRAELEDFYNTAASRHHTNLINQEFETHPEWYQHIQPAFEQNQQKHFNARGEFVAPYYSWNPTSRQYQWETAWDTLNKPLFNEVNQGANSVGYEPTYDHYARMMAFPTVFLPSKTQKVGSSTVEWFEPNPGEAVITATGGSLDDRAFAEQFVKIQLEAFGIKRIAFDVEGTLEKTADWDDIMAKAKRLIQSGNVTILRNGWNVVAGHVIGDHGEYNAEIGRDDPASRSITTWQCECPWDQYAWQRTRKWKKYEGRPCAHVMALYWSSLAAPLDDYNPAEHGPLPPGQAGGPPTPLELQHSMEPDQHEAPEGDEEQAPIPGMEQYGPLPDNEPAQAPMAPPGPPGHLPQAPMDALQQQMQPPIPGTAPSGTTAPPGTPSVPGMRQPSPYNPIQYPGGTYSATGDTFMPPEIVRLNEPVYGLAEGKSEEHGAGQYREIPQGSTGEVISQDATTGWVEVIFPLKGGELTPYHVRCFLEPSQISKTDHQPPGPFIRRRH